MLRDKPLRTVCLLATRDGSLTRVVFGTIREPAGAPPEVTTTATLDNVSAEWFNHLFDLCEGFQMMRTAAADITKSGVSVGGLAYVLPAELPRRDNSGRLDN